MGVTMLVSGVPTPFYDNEAQRLMNNAVALLEPIIIVILGLIVAFILIGLYTPMFGMYGGVGL